MTARPTKTTEYIRHNFSESERLQMGTDLAESHNRISDIESEESVVKAQFKERRAGIEQKIGTLSRNLASGFEFRNVSCVLNYDDPKPNEVSYYREDNNEVVKTRAMTKDELQQELDFNKPVVIPPAKSAENIEQFFKSDESTAVTPAEQEAFAGDSKPEDGPGSGAGTLRRGTKGK